MRIAVISVNYFDAVGTVNFVRSCITDDHEVEFFITDNSCDHVQYNILKNTLNSEFVHLIRASDNLGYAAGINLSLDYLRGNSEDFEYICVTNTDIVLDWREILNQLVLYYDNLDSVGLIAPKQRNGTDNKVVYSCKADLAFDIVSNIPFFGSKLLTKFNIGEKLLGVSRVYSVPGAFMFGSTDLWLRTLFPLDEEFFLYCEERSIGHVLETNGFANYIINSIHYDHAVSKVIGERYSGLEKLKLAHRSIIRFHRKYNKTSRLFMSILIIYFGLIRHVSKIKTSFK